jgi:hypothetical protein
MYDYEITRVSWTAVFRVFFAAGTCVGGMVGIVLGLMEHSLVGLMGGAFLGLAAGLASGAVAAAYAAVFNLLAPYFGGIGVSLTEKAAGTKQAEAVSVQEPPAAGKGG